MEYKKLNDIAKLVGGYSFKSSNYVADGLRVIRIANVQDGYISDDYPCFYPLSIQKELGDANLFENDLLMSLTGNVGRVAFVNKELLPAGLNQRVECIRPFREDDKKFLFYYFQSKKFREQAEKNSSGSAQLNMSTVWLANHLIPDYSHEIKLKIVNELENLSSSIKRIDKDIACLNELVKSRFIEMFGEPIRNTKGLKTISIKESCFVTKLAGFEYSKYIHYQDVGDVVMVKAQNVKNCQLNEKELSYITSEVSNSLPRSQLKPGDVVMTYVGANIGDVAIIDKKHKYHLAPNVAMIRPKQECFSSRFLMYMLNMMRDYVVGNSADTAKGAIGMERIRQLVVLCPNLEEQGCFSQFVQTIDKSKFILCIAE